MKCSLMSQFFVRFIEVVLEGSCTVPWLSHTILKSLEEVFFLSPIPKGFSCQLLLSYKHCRKRNKCEAKWISLGSFAGMAEVVKFKGNHLKSTGIVRDGRVLLHVEEISYLMQKEALTVQNGDFSMTIMDIYTHLMTGEYGCSWDAFKVYLELKTLGYIVGRHNVLWSMKSRILENSHKKSSDEVSSRFERLQLMDESHIQDHAEAHANTLPDSRAIASFGVHMHEDKTTHRNVDLMFDVFPPNSSFKKTNPGNPDFSLCVSSNLPPDSAHMEALKIHSKNLPVTIATVDSGRVSFFHFDEVQLPHLP